MLMSILFLPASKKPAPINSERAGLKLTRWRFIVGSDSNCFSEFSSSVPSSSSSPSAWADNDTCPSFILIYILVSSLWCSFISGTSGPFLTSFFNVLYVFLPKSFAIAHFINIIFNHDGSLKLLSTLNVSPSRWQNIWYSFSTFTQSRFAKLCMTRNIFLTLYCFSDHSHMSFAFFETPSSCAFNVAYESRYTAANRIPGVILVSQ
mmetsp:Transcript_20407/g.33675  ORF Transcript_20407/g.33675 Transcript_20407/m.33675 type:complete len:206 (+) Transcript_20407:802-1419(+)